MVEVKEKRISDGYDCWGRPEYDYVYVVLDENGNEIFQSRNDPTSLVNMLINKNNTCINTIEQIRWERDIALSQLEELGLSLGQKVDHVKEVIEKSIPMKPNEVKGIYEITKHVCPRCGNDLLGEYCCECGQRIDCE